MLINQQSYPVCYPSMSAGKRRDQAPAAKTSLLSFATPSRTGPVGAKEFEQRAVAAGLLDAGKSIGDAKVFRTALRLLGVKTVQRSGLKAGGWVCRSRIRRPPPCFESPSLLHPSLLRLG